MNLSDIDPAEVSLVSQAGPSPGIPTTPNEAPLTLAQVDPADVKYVAPNALQSQYGTPSEQWRTLAESTGSGATLGASDYLAAAADSAEAVRKRREANPWTHFIGTGLGGAGLAAATGGLGGLLEGGVASQAGAGLVFGAGNVMSDLALGDPNLNAQKMLANLGTGAALGAGFGVLSKAIETVPGLLRGAKTVAAPGEIAVQVPKGVSEPIVDVPVGGKRATTYEELQKQVQDYKKFSGNPDFNQLPEKPEALAAADRLEQMSDLPIPITKMQRDSLNSQDDRLAFKTKAEVPGDEGQLLRDTITGQKQSLKNLLDKTIDNIAAGHEVTDNAAEAGQRISKILTENDQKIRDNLGPAFEKIKATPLQEADHLPGVVDYLIKADPNLRNIFEPGDLTQLKPNNGQTGIADKTYSKIKKLVTDLKDNPNDFEGLKNLREGLTDGVNVLEDSRASKQLSQAKTAMMDYIQDAVQKVEPDLQVRQIFKEWAINEQNKDFLQSVIKAKVGTNWRDIEGSKLNPDEAIHNKIFQNSALTKQVKQMMTPDQFNQTLADHMAILKSEVTDKEGFSPNKFHSKVSKGNSKYALDEAFADSPQYQKMKDIITTMRAFTDFGPINPSGTAKTLLQAIINSAKHPSETLGQFGEYLKEKGQNIHLRAEINQQLAEGQDQNAKMKTLSNMIKRTTNQIKDGAKGIFKNSPTKGAVLGVTSRLSDSEYDKHITTLKKFSSYPQDLVDHLARNTEGLQQAAPSITQGLHQAVVSAVSFLSSKIPQAPNQLALSPEWEPSQSQKRQFNQYYHAVNQPISSLHDVKNGSLTNQTMEALQAVHPQLLEEMRRAVISQIKPEDHKKLPMAQKAALSKFLGQPVDNNLMPQAIQSNQMALNANLSQQNAPKQGRKTSLGGLKQLNQASRAATTTERAVEEK